jgi:hypothetical protein
MHAIWTLSRTCWNCSWNSTWALNWVSPMHGDMTWSRLCIGVFRPLNVRRWHLKAPSRQDRQKTSGIGSLGQETQLGVLETPRMSFYTSASKQKTFKHLYKLVQACTSCKSSEFDNSTSYVRKSARPFLILPHKSSKLTTLERLQDLKTSEAHKISERSQDDNYDIGIYVK